MTREITAAAAKTIRTVREDRRINIELSPTGDPIVTAYGNVVVRDANGDIVGRAEPTTLESGFETTVLGTLTAEDRAAIDHLRTRLAGIAGNRERKRTAKVEG